MNASEKRVGAMFMLNDQVPDAETTGQKAGAVYRKGVTDLIVNGRTGLGHHLDPIYANAFGAIIQSARELSNERPREPRRKVWFTELNWPSGNSGGKVTKNPDFRAKAAKPGRNGEIKVRESQFPTAYSFGKDVDRLSRAATNAYLATTHNWYLENFPEAFKEDLIGGDYCDEPAAGYADLFNIIDRGCVPFTEELPERYQQMHGVPLEKDFPHIWGGQDWVNRIARGRISATITTLYGDNWFSPIRDWCDRQGVGLFGHILQEENPLDLIAHEGDPFKVWPYFDVVGVDQIGPLVKTSHILAMKSAQAVASLTRRPGIMVEAFGGSGHPSLEDIDETIEYLLDNGVTFPIIHGFFTSLEGRQRQYDAPPSFFEEPYWGHVGNMVEHFKNEIDFRDGELVVYYPVDAIIATRNPSKQEEARRISRALQDTASSLYGLRDWGDPIDFDILNDERILRGDLSGRRRIFMPRATAISVEILGKIAKFSADGGEVVFVDGLPEYPLREEDQEVFDRAMAAIMEGKIREIEGRKPSRLSIEAALNAAEGHKYLLWHHLSSINPWWEHLHSKYINGSVELGARWMDRRLVGSDTVVNIGKKVKNYFFR